MNQCDKAGYCACDAGTCRISELEAEVEQEIEKRDFAQDCLQNAHIALGGDGEWKGKLPPEPPPDSGDLHYDVPALAEEVMECLNAAEAKLAAIDGWPTYPAKHVHRDVRVMVASDIQAILRESEDI